MDATVRATCPSCGNSLRIPVQWIGQAVKCKKCATVVQVRAKGSVPSDVCETAAASGEPDPNAFDFSKPSPEDDFFPLSGPPPGPEVNADNHLDPTGSVPPIAPAVAPPAAPASLSGPPSMPGMPLGYPYPVPSGYLSAGAYGPSAGYPYPGPSGYPYPVPPGYPPPGYAPPAAPVYGLPPGYVMPPPGLPYPTAVPGGTAAPSPAEVPPPSPPPASAVASPATSSPIAQATTAATAARPTTPSKPLKPSVTTSGQGDKPPPATPALKTMVDPVPTSNEFKTELPVPTPGRRRYRRANGTGKIVWAVVSLVLTAGLVAGGILGARYLNEQQASGNKEKKEEEKTEGKAEGDKPVASAKGGFPRRMLFIHISRYMFLNPLTYAQQLGGSIGEDRTKGMAQRLAYEWQIPNEPRDPDRNQLFILSDTARPDNPKSIDVPNPMRNVVMGAYERFFATSRAQDRIVVYFGGHALEINGTAYLAPIEGDPDDPENTLIPLSDFYEKLKACKATQKVVIWDVCRYNPQRGKQRPGSEPMSESLYNALTAAPPGVEVITACQPGENALEFFNLQTEPGLYAPKYAGSLFLEAAKHVAAKNVRMSKQAMPSDPIPVTEWAASVAKRAAEMADSPVVGLKQTVKLSGKAKETLVAYNPDELPAKRFDFPSAPKGISGAEIAKIADEFTVPPIKSDLADTGLTEIAFRPDVMKDYLSDVTPTDIAKDPERYRFHATTLKVINKIREMWKSTPGSAGGPQLRDGFKAPVNDKLKKDIKDEQDFWAAGIAELELLNLEIDSIEPMRAEQSKRWQANYDYARAVLKARLAFMNEYNKALGDVLTETLPPLDMKLGQDSYKLASSEKMKSKRDIQKLAEEARELLTRIVAEHKGTPWAIQAKRDKTLSLGLTWQPISSGDAGKD